MARWQSTKQKRAAKRRTHTALCGYCTGPEARVSLSVLRRLQMICSACGGYGRVRRDPRAGMCPEVRS